VQLKSTRPALLLAGLIMPLPVAGQTPLGTAFTYQGRLPQTDDLCVCRNDAGSFAYFGVLDGTAAGCD
jgi:hypothetical protein